MLSNPLCFLPCFNCIHYCFSLSNFCIKSYKRVFWSFPTKEPILSPYNLSLSLFNLFAWIISQILHKNRLSFASESVWVSLSRFCPPRGILVFSHHLNFGQRGILKYLICGSLFVLVRFVNFKCFTLRYFQIYIFLQILFHFLQFSPNFVLNYKSVQILIFKTVQIPFNFQVSPFFLFYFQNSPDF